MSARVKTKHGRTLAAGDVDALARKAEQGFDLSTWQPRRGRPSLDASTGSHSPRVSVRVPEALHRRATARAADEGRSVSDVVRDLLEGYASDGPVEPAASVRADRGRAR